MAFIVLPGLNIEAAFWLYDKGRLKV
jgi:hypothetical protein